MSRECCVCGKRAYSDYCFSHKPRSRIQSTKPLPRPTKRIRQVSDKQAEYHKWLEEIARPYLINRDGNMCSCCARYAYPNEKLDIEHTLGVGSHAHLKKDLDNLTLMCRFPCHRNKTDGKICDHLI